MMRGQQNIKFAAFEASHCMMLSLGTLRKVEISGKFLNVLLEEDGKDQFDRSSERRCVT
jgi:hypothetical protein